MATARLTVGLVRQMLRARFPGRQAEVIAQVTAPLTTDVDAINTAVNSLVAAVNTLATNLNTLATKLNADAGVTDTNYVNTNATNNAGTGV